MAAAPAYFATAKIGYARITTGQTATDGSGTGNSTITWYNTAPNADWMLVKILVTSTSSTGVGNIADSAFHIFVSDGTTDRLIRSYDWGDPTVNSTTVIQGQYEFNFGPEFVFPSTVLPEFSCSVTPTAGNIDIVVFAQMV